MNMYTTAQARHLLQVDAKTFLKWLEKDGIGPQVDKADNRIKLFTQEQIEQLADLHGRIVTFQEQQQLATKSREQEQDSLLERVAQLEQSLEATTAGASPDFGDINHLENRLETLEERLTRVEQLVETLLSEKPPHPAMVKPARAEYTVTAVQDTPMSSLPDDAVTLASFAAMHTIPESTYKRHSQEISAIKGHGGKWYLDRNGKAQFYQWAHTHPTFSPCESCPHGVI